MKLSCKFNEIDSFYAFVYEQALRKKPQPHTKSKTLPWHKYSCIEHLKASYIEYVQHLICTQWISFIEGWAYLVKQDKSFALEESMEWLIINFFWGNISSQKTTWLCLRFAEACA